MSSRRQIPLPSIHSGISTSDREAREGKSGWSASSQEQPCLWLTRRLRAPASSTADILSREIPSAVDLQAGCLSAHSARLVRSSPRDKAHGTNPKYRQAPSLAQASVAAPPRAKKIKGVWETLVLAAAASCSFVPNAPKSKTGYPGSRAFNYWESHIVRENAIRVIDTPLLLIETAFEPRLRKP